MVTRRKTFRYHPNNPKSPSSRHEYQLPISFYLNKEDPDTPGLSIKIAYILGLNLCVPYIAAITLDETWEPFEIPEDLFPELLNASQDRKNLNMRTFRLSLPKEIARQYFYAELFQIPGCTFIPQIESGAVIRNLLEKISDRLYSMEFVDTFDTHPETMPKSIEA